MNGKRKMKGWIKTITVCVVYILLLSLILLLNKKEPAEETQQQIQLRRDARRCSNKHT